MNKKVIGATVVALPLAVGSLAVLANSAVKPTETQVQATEHGYTCPVTGEELPCPNCCPLNNSAAE